MLKIIQLNREMLNFYAAEIKHMDINSKVGACVLIQYFVTANRWNESFGHHPHQIPLEYMTCDV